jgi:hypothetical protein
MEVLQIGLATLRDHFLSNRRIGCLHHEATTEHLDPTRQTMIRGIPLQVQCSEELLRLYDRAFCFVESANCCLPLEVFTAIILYNMGLMHHIRGLTHGQSHFLDQAYRFYQISADVLDKKNESVRVNPLFLLALFNNMAHIAATLLRADEMQSSLRTVQSVLVNDGYCIDEEDFEIFRNNTICYTAEFTTAPAA